MLSSRVAFQQDFCRQKQIWKWNSVQHIWDHQIPYACPHWLCRMSFTYKQANKTFFLQQRWNFKALGAAVLCLIPCYAKLEHRVNFLQPSYKPPWKQVLLWKCKHKHGYSNMKGSAIIILRSNPLCTIGIEKYLIFVRFFLLVHVSVTSQLVSVYNKIHKNC